MASVIARSARRSEGEPPVVSVPRFRRCRTCRSTNAPGSRALARDRGAAGRWSDDGADGADHLARAQRGRAHRARRPRGRRAGARCPSPGSCSTTPRPTTRWSACARSRPRCRCMRALAGTEAPEVAGAADRLARAAAPRAFNRALRAAGVEDFTHVMKLDGDVELPPEYLRVLDGALRGRSDARHRLRRPDRGDGHRLADAPDPAHARPRGAQVLLRAPASRPSAASRSASAGTRSTRPTRRHSRGSLDVAVELHHVRERRASARRARQASAERARRGGARQAVEAPPSRGRDDALGTGSRPRGGRGSRPCRSSECVVDDDPSRRAASVLGGDGAGRRARRAPPRCASGEMIRTRRVHRPTNASPRSGSLRPGPPARRRVGCARRRRSARASTTARR